jgi:hypothetical protein
VPDARDQNICGRRDDRVAHDLTRCSEPDDDLPDISIGGGHAKLGKFLQSFNRGQNGDHRTTCGLGIDLIEKSPHSLDVRAKERSSDLAR